MAKKETKRQHFVPQAYLKNFSSEKGGEFFINALPTSSPSSDKIFTPNIKNIAIEKDIYTLPGDTEDERQLIERFYSDNFEAHYDKVYQILTDPTKNSVTAAERELIISTVVTMFYRTTKWINSHNEFMTRVIHDMFALAKQAGTDYFMFEKEKISIEVKSSDTTNIERFRFFVSKPEWNKAMEDIESYFFFCWVGINISDDSALYGPFVIPAIQLIEIVPKDVSNTCEWSECRFVLDISPYKWPNDAATQKPMSN